MGVEYDHLLLPRPATFKPEPEALANLIDLWVREGWVPAGLKGWARQLRAFHVTNLGPRGELPPAGHRLYGPRHHAPQHEKREKIHSNGVTPPLSAAWFAENLAKEIVTVKLLPWDSMGCAHHSTAELYINFDFALEYDERKAHTRFAACQWNPDVGDYEPEIKVEPRIPFSPFDITQATYTLGIEIAEDLINRNYETVPSLDEQDTICRQCGKQLSYEMAYRQASSGGDLRICANCPHCGMPFDPSDLFVTGHSGFTGERRHYQGGAVSRFAIVIKGTIPDTPVVIDPRFRTQCEDALGCALGCHLHDVAGWH